VILFGVLSLVPNFLLNAMLTFRGLTEHRRSAA
jgi:hypothetical protein